MSYAVKSILNTIFSTGDSIDFKKIHKILFLMEYRYFHLLKSRLIDDHFVIKYNSLYIPSVRNGILFESSMDEHIISNFMFPNMDYIQSEEVRNFIVQYHKLYDKMTIQELNRLILIVSPNILNYEFVDITFFLEN